MGPAVNRGGTGPNNSNDEVNLYQGKEAGRATK